MIGDKRGGGATRYKEGKWRRDGRMALMCVHIYGKHMHTHTSKGHFSPLKTLLKVSPVIHGMDACVTVNITHM